MTADVGLTRVLDAPRGVLYKASTDPDRPAR
jgi:hypothetical protein